MLARNHRRPTIGLILWISRDPLHFGRGASFGDSDLTLGVQSLANHAGDAVLSAVVAGAKADTVNSAGCGLTMHDESSD